MFSGTFEKFPDLKFLFVESYMPLKTGPFIEGFFK
jgi:hypothetical protein